MKPIQIEKVIKAGAMDCFGQNKRNAMVLGLPRAVGTADEKSEDKRRGQKSMFDMFGGGDEGEAETPGTIRFAETLPDVAEWGDLEKLKFEKEVLDFYMSSHPLAQFEDQLRRYRSHGAGQVAKLQAGVEVRLAGLVIDIQGKQVMKGRNQGNRWAIVRIEDFTGSVKCIFWSDQFQRFGDDLKPDAILIFDGKVEWREGSGEPDVIVERVITMDQARSELTKGVLLRMNYRTDEDGRQLFQSLGAILKKSKGGTPVEMAILDPAGRVARFKLASEYFVDHMQIPVEQLEMVLGPGSVHFTGR